MTLILNSSIVVLLMTLILCSVTSDDQVCRVEERPNIGLARLEPPAMLIDVSYDAHSAGDCFRMCCNKPDQCNSVSFYRLDASDVCMLLNCRPFKSCVWMSSQGFTAGRVKMTSVNGAVPSPQPPNNEQSPQQPTSLANVPMTSPQTTTVAVVVTTVAPTPAPVDTPASNSSNESISNEEQPWNVESFQDVVNGNPPQDIHPEEAVGTGQLETGQDSSVQGDFSFYNQTDEFSNETEIIDSDQNNGGPNPDEVWNVDGEPDFGQADDSSNISEIDQGPNDNRTTAVAADRSSTEEPWNIGDPFAPFQTDTEDQNGQQETDSIDSIDQSIEPNDNELTDGPFNDEETSNLDVFDDNNEEIQNPDDDAFANGDITENDQPTDDPKNDFVFEGNDQEPIGNGFTEQPAVVPENPTNDQPQQPFEEPSNQGQWDLPSIIEDLPPSNPEDQFEEDQSATSRPVRTRMLVQTPGIIIGLCSALGVAFLVLVAVCRKIYTSQDRPKYKPLRDYDVRFDPPAASSALLP